MKDLLLYIARALVEHPEDVAVTEVAGENGLTLKLRVNPDDMGRIIGRQGRTAREIRTIISSRAQRDGVRAFVDIID